jgi:hypothetical protein
MTKLNPQSPVVRETNAQHRGRPIIAELRGGGILVLRVKGLKTGSVDFELSSLYEHGLIRDARLANAK